MALHADYRAIDLMLLSHLGKANLLTGDWRKRHNEERHNLYSSPNFITMMVLHMHVNRVQSTT